MNKAIQLRKLVTQKSEPIQIAGAHDGLTAKLVERAGFDGIWASGLEISTSYAVPDANILTMSQFLERATEMNDASNLPIIADCDTGFGNSNNVMYMVNKYESAGIAAVCIEDKQFPKVNSLLTGGRQELATVAEFVGKIMAAKSAQRTSEFMVIARVEALIAGWGMEEALYRAHAYVEAGADAILIHSKAKTPEEIIEFSKLWNQRAPLIVVPTNYSQVKVSELNSLGVKIVIYANHGIRSSVYSVQKTFEEIRNAGYAKVVDDHIATMQEIFELQGMPVMKEQEKNYLRTGRKNVTAVILAAGDHLEEYSMKPIASDIPMAMIDINGKPLITRQVEVLHKAGIEKVLVVGGYKKNLIQHNDVEVVVNDDYDNTGILHSLFCARRHFGDGDLLILYGDVLFDNYLIERFFKSPHDITIVVDSSSLEKDYKPGKKVDRVIVEEKPLRYRRKVDFGLCHNIRHIGQNVPVEEADYEFPGFTYIRHEAIKGIEKVYDDYQQKPQNLPFHSAKEFRKAGLSDMLQELIVQNYNVRGVEVDSGWLEIHSMDDYRVACKMMRR